MSISTCRAPAGSTHRLVGFAKGIARAVFSFECVFVLFIYSGVYKGDPRFAAIPIDLTLLSGTATVVAGGYVMLRRGTRVTLKGVIATYLGCLFFLWMASTFLWSPVPDSAAYKAMNMIPLVLLSFLMSALVVAPEPERVRRFLVIAVLFASWVSLETYIAYSRRTPGTSLMVMSGDYTGVGRVLGPGWIITYVDALFRVRNRLVLATEIGLLFYFGFALLIVGSRQTIIALALVALLPNLRLVRFRSQQGAFVNRRRWLVLAILLLCFLGILRLRSAGVEMNTLERLALLFPGGSAGTGVESRLVRMRWAIEGWKQSPLIGRGLAAFGALYGVTPIVRAYPHNILLEILFEGGIVGLTLFLLLILYCVMSYRSTMRTCGSSWYKSILLLVVFAGVSTLVSNTYAEERSFFSLLGLLCADPVNRAVRFRSPNTDRGRSVQGEYLAR